MRRAWARTSLCAKAAPGNALSPRRAAPPAFKTSRLFNWSCCFLPVDAHADFTSVRPRRPARARPGCRGVSSRGRPRRRDAAGELPVEHEGGRQDADAPRPGHGAVGIEQHGKVDRRRSRGSDAHARAPRRRSRPRLKAVRSLAAQRDAKATTTPPGTARTRWRRSGRARPVRPAASTRAVSPRDR